MTRVVVVGPVANDALERSFKNRGHHTLVAEDARHALLLQRMFQPDVLVFPRLPEDTEMALLASSASRPVVVIADLSAAAAVDRVREGVARVVPTSAPPNVIDVIIGLPLARERPVVRAIAQLSLLKATGALQVGAGVGAIVVDEGAIYSVKAGELTGSAALAALAQLEAPLAFSFVEGTDVLPGIEVVEGAADEAFAVVDEDVDSAVSIPRAPVTDQEIAKLPAPKALIVEDDVDLLNLYRVLLTAKGFAVTIAQDGEEGFAKALATAPDVILSDIMMPRASGWDLLGMVRNNARLRETPFLVFSHHQEMLQRLKTANGGADAYLDKTLRPDAVVSVVQAVVQPRRDIEIEVQAGAPRFEGNLFGLGPQTLLRLCNRQRLTGRLAVRPQHQRFLITLHEGDIVDAQCSMGTSTLHHRDALRALLLVDDGPFTFVRGAAPATAPKTPLAPLLDELNAELEHLLDDLRTGALLNGTALKVRKELLDVYRTTSPQAAAPVLDQIEKGLAPRDLIASGAVDLVLVDSVVRDLFRKGVVTP